MSFQITTAFVKQFSANVFHLSQQKGTRLSDFVRKEMVRGEVAFFDRIGSVAAIEKVSRHSDTPQLDTPHSRRRVTLKDFEWADLIDKEDKIRTLFDPANPYAQSAGWAFGRSKDDEIISAALGNAFGGNDGGTTVSFPNPQRVAAHDGTSAVGVNLNVRTLRKVKQKFDENDVDESIPRYIAITSSQLQSLLSETEVTSADFNTVRALVMGEVDNYMGFKFIRTERLGRLSAALSSDQDTGAVPGGGTQLIAFATSRRCIAWAQDGLLLAMGSDVKTRIDERADKSYATQVYAAMSIGATRMEEEKVVEVICAELN